MKLNYVLALTDKMKVSYKNMVKDYTKFFTKSQGAFLGQLDTYKAREGFYHEPNKEKSEIVSTTVDEKFDYFIENTKEFISSLFIQEATNASSLAKAELVVEGESWGWLSSLELLKLKSILESSDLGNICEMLSSIPVRSDKKLWKKSVNGEYEGRSIFEAKLEEGEALTTIKEAYILEDPNIGKLKDVSNYQPAAAHRDKVIPKGDYTKQSFSGEWTQRQRAESLRKRDVLILAVYKALKEANDVDVVESDLTGTKLFNYLLR